MNHTINIALLISFVGIAYYSIWVGVLVIGSLKEPHVDFDPNQIPTDMKLFILIPMLNEAGVVDSTLSQFLANTKAIPQIQLGVIDDCSDDGTADLIQKFINSHHCNHKIHLIRRTFPNAQTGKGDALNYGLKFIRKQVNNQTDNVIVGVLDADAIMHQNDFLKVIAQFAEDPELALLQIKVRMTNAKNWLQKMQDIEFATINNWIQRIRNKIHNAAASGNGQFIRMTAIEDNPAPWGNALLEDFEFSTKFLLKGKKTLYRSDIIVYQEAVNKVQPFIRQRSRWVQGGLDSTGKYMKPIFTSKELGFWAKFEMIFFMLLPFLTVMVGLSNLATLIFAIFHLRLFIGLFIFLIAINLLLAYYMGVKYCQDARQVNLKILFSCAGMIIYNIILFPAIIIAFYRKITGQQKWIKTAHGQENVTES